MLGLQLHLPPSSLHERAGPHDCRALLLGRRRGRQVAVKRLSRRLSSISR